VGIGEVGPQLLKANMENTARTLTRCYKRLWETERWPEAWKNGLIVKIFKKGDLHDCSNWRRVTLLPVISKNHILQDDVRAYQDRCRQEASKGAGWV